MHRRLLFISSTLPAHAPVGGRGPDSRGPRRFLASLLSALLVLLPLLAAPAGAAGPAVEITAVNFSGPAVVSSLPWVLLSGTGVTLTVTTDADAGCVMLAGGFVATLDLPTATTATTKTWAFTGLTTTAASGSVTISGHNNNNCTQNTHSTTATVGYTIAIRPTLAATVSPAPNADGWHSGDVTVSLAAGAVGSAIASITYSAGGAQTIPSTTIPGAAGTVAITAEGTTTLTATALDFLGILSLEASVTVKIDRSAPTIAGSRSPAANAGGWNNADVTVSFTCADDGPSGIASCSGPATLAAEGAGQSVTGTATDNAGNSATATVSGINIDTTAPTLTGTPTAAPNAAGWYTGDVAVAWACTDALSGVAGSCPADSTITAEGIGLTANASIGDKAGNATNATSSPAVSIDRTAPNTGHDAPGTWNNSTVTVTLSPADALSGVATTYYTLDGGAQQTGTAVVVAGEGDHTLTFWSVDNAGNAEAAKTVQVKIDLTAPTIGHTQAPAANASGWNNTAVTVTFTCTANLSGINSCTTPQAVTTEGQGQSVTGTATDNAGNSATDTATVNIDLTAPTIGGSASPAANASGWNNTAVTVTFTCADALSGIDSCTTPVTIGGAGAGQSATGTAVDAAGNSATATVSGINIDTTAPTLTGTPTAAPNAAGWYTGDVAVAWACTDALSGVATAPPASSTIGGEGANLSASATCTDNAGNVASATVSGVKIDRTAPGTTASVPAPPHVGSVTVTLAAADGLSGVAATYYRVDGGATQTYAGPFALAAGAHTVTFWSADTAGNVEDGNAQGNRITATVIPLVLLTVGTTGGGVVVRDLPGTGSGPYAYPAGTLVTLTPQPGAGQTFIGWTVDGVYKGWANPLDLTMGSDHTVVAAFVPTVTFPDAGAGHPYRAAIVALASRGTIRGYQDGRYGPGDTVLRAQMAALIARATAAGPGTPPTMLAPPACLVAGTWDCEAWGTNFTDRGTIDANLWRNAGTLQHYGVALGYTAQDCAEKGLAFPCYGPNDLVSHAETIAFITRAMIAKGYWTAQPGAPLPYGGVPGVLATEVATFHHYTGGIADAPGSVAAWNNPATRGWFAQALWAALDSYWGTDGQLADSDPAGGFVP